MIDPFVELGGWIIAQAMEDALGKDEATDEEVNDAWRFLLYDPLIDHVLEHIDYGPNDMSKREYIVKIVITKKAFDYTQAIAPKPLDKVETIPAP